MTTLTFNTFNGLPAVADQRVTGQQDIDEVVGAVDTIDIPILADGILFVVATLISRFVNRVFGATECSADLVELPDYYYPNDCCCV